MTPAVPYWPLAASSWGEEEIAAMRAVIVSGQFTMGPKVKEFEAACAAHFGMPHAIMVNSGSSANLIAVAALFHTKERALKRGDECIVPAISWATTYHPLQQYGLRLRFIDVELDSLNMDCRWLERALTPRTKALMAVSILGNPCALDVQRDFCDRHGLWFIEDNCESMDAVLGGRKAGTFGDLTTHSFFFSHHMSTMEGGLVMCRELELDHLCRALRAHGWTRDLPHDSPIYSRTGADFFEAYRFILPGYNVRPLELSAAAGLEQLKKLPAMIAARRANLAHFQSLFDGDDRFITPRENGASSSFTFPIVLNPRYRFDRNKVFAALDSAGIQYRIITGGNMLRHDVMKYYDYEIVGNGCPNADIAHDHGFFVGNHPFDLTERISKLRDILDEVCR